MFMEVFPRFYIGGLEQVFTHWFATVLVNNTAPLTILHSVISKLNFCDLVAFCISTRIFEEIIVKKYVKNKTITG